VRRGRTHRAGPAVTATLVALNVAVFAVTALQAHSVVANAAAPLFADWALVPRRVVAGGEWWRIVTGGFLHYGPIHLAFNMLALWMIGRDVETVLGRGRYLAVYLVSLLGGSAAVLLFSPANAAVAGASGAVFGLMGGLGVLLRRLRMPTGQVVGLVVANLVITFLIPGISVAGHVGGLVAGAAATTALAYAPARHRAVLPALLVGLAVLVVAAIVLGGSALV
jgi:membrane associated rhomboid family serine protease